eukprot:GHVU01012679.1.p1 GENE.GHVU01012679.1~~GHVU01012679.1.p1  ORF type:complete len:139 (+),score=5.89 GHVU01012679.1:636-1052(+)
MKARTLCVRIEYVESWEDLGTSITCQKRFPYHTCLSGDSFLAASVPHCSPSLSLGSSHASPDAPPPSTSTIYATAHICPLTTNREAVAFFNLVFSDNQHTERFWRTQLLTRLLTECGVDLRKMHRRAVNLVSLFRVRA